MSAAAVISRSYLGVLTYWNALSEINSLTQDNINDLNFECIFPELIDIVRTFDIDNEFELYKSSIFGTENMPFKKNQGFFKEISKVVIRNKKSVLYFKCCPVRSYYSTNLTKDYCMSL